ncbi:tryptophan--tRNA ligase [Alkalicaulis satelles]|uniref:Tryptophan--tRNA ligase n=1 Tax=Alkalicaulis satelles TaxID=2609175 RepID=A0A5M6ZFA1_9PROT|nr:tryptophan--tRNA ligase [Alkalicaulis satelles]KAA5803399.1 tryptophan--tRNA ligase [Alkalicaulis satelles]
MSDAPAPYAGPERILSGMQPTGGLHLGNYLGALKHWVRLQEGVADCFYCVVDMHAITVAHDPADLPGRVRSAAAAYLAAGVDPKRSAVFAQSAVPAHAELAWIFQCVARLGWLERMTQFKDKAGKDAERASVGLFTYPVLQAADILIYKATHVPVGEDQKQHLELSRDIAARFNRDFGAGASVMPLPEPVIPPAGAGARIMSLKDGTAKMSKSDPSDNSRINLHDDADTIARKIRKAKTDAEPLPGSADALEARPEARNLVGIYAALTGQSVQAVLDEYAGQGFGAFKPKLADIAVEFVAPIAGEYARLIADPAEIDRILKNGAERARAVAEPVITEVRDLVGYWKG